MRLPKLDPEYGYIGTSLFLPKKYVREAPIQGALTFGSDDEGDIRTLVTNHKEHLEVPRAFLTGEQIADMGIKLMDLRPPKFDPISLRPKDGFSLRVDQHDAWEALKGADGGILNLACGKGKTVMGLLKAAHEGVPTLIVSYQNAHLDNWTDELNTLFELDGPIGRIRGKKMEWECEVVMATVQTLADRAVNGGLPPGFHNRFGLTIYDECHNLSAKWFMHATDICMGKRLGLTATPERVDGNEGIFFAHLGPIFFTDMEQDLSPVFEITETGIDASEAERKEHFFNAANEVHHYYVKSWLAENSDRNAVIMKKLNQRLAEGRTIYVLSHVPEQVQWLHEQYPGSGLITGDTPASERMHQLRNHNPVFATVGVGAEAYNRKDLDTLMVLTPFTAHSHAAPKFIQMVGRILRALAGKKQPIVDLFLDIVPESRGQIMSLIRKAKEMNYVVRSGTWNRPKHRLR